LGSLVGLHLAITITMRSRLVGESTRRPTARLAGRISLNPLRHLDPQGTIMMLFTVLTGLWHRLGQAVPVTPYRQRFGTRWATVWWPWPAPPRTCCCRRSWPDPAPGGGLLARLAVPIWLVIVYMNIVIAIFNLLPIPPLAATACCWPFSASFAGAGLEVSQFIDSSPARVSGSSSAVVLAQLFDFTLFSAIIRPPPTGSPT
jgi:hypothetical protein